MAMKNNTVGNAILICSDLDRTILPNGEQEESPRARPLLKKIADSREVVLAYVSGRNKRLLQEAIAHYDIPVPAYAVGDVGTSIYEINAGDWTMLQDWEEEIGHDWNGLEHDDIVEILDDLSELRLQEDDAQNTHKVSYYADADTDRDSLLEKVRKDLKPHQVDAALIWSIDEANQTGLLDVLPQKATKLHAVRFLIQRLGTTEDQTVFAGDSGNDLPALTSGLQAILVRNASEDVRAEAIARLESKGLRHRLYLPQGGFQGMNGNYAAGVIEGIAHFFPQTLKF